MRLARNQWFESVAVARRRAKRHLPTSVYSALIAGSESGSTLDDDVAAFGELGFAPHVGGARAQREMATTVMGQEISLPVLISPTGSREQITARIDRGRARLGRGD